MSDIDKYNAWIADQIAAHGPDQTTDHEAAFVLAKACAWVNPPQRGYRARVRGTNGSWEVCEGEENEKADGVTVSAPPASRKS